MHHGSSAHDVGVEGVEATHPTVEALADDADVDRWLRRGTSTATTSNGGGTGTGGRGSGAVARPNPRSSRYMYRPSDYVSTATMVAPHAPHHAHESGARRPARRAGGAGGVGGATPAADEAADKAAVAAAVAAEDGRLLSAVDGDPWRGSVAAALLKTKRAAWRPTPLSFEQVGAVHAAQQQQQRASW